MRFKQFVKMKIFYKIMFSCRARTHTYLNKQSESLNRECGILIWIFWKWGLMKFNEISIWEQKKMMAAQVKWHTENGRKWRRTHEWEFSLSAYLFFLPSLKWEKQRQTKLTKLNVLYNRKEQAGAANLIYITWKLSKYVIILHKKHRYLCYARDIN